MTTKLFAAELREGEFTQTTFLLVRKELRTSRGGDAYLRVVLEDRTGRLEGRAWTDPKALASRVDVDDFVAVRGELVLHKDALQLNIDDIDRVADASVDPADYFPVSRWSADDMFGQLQALLDEELESEAIRAFLDALFDDANLARRFRTAPAAVTNHHAYRGGLLEHCLSMCRVALRLADHYALYYPGLIHRDLLVAGVILHDVAKVWELSYRRRFDYTAQGRLIGHIPMGAELISTVAARSRRPISEDLQMHLKHLVLSHHGELEYGSPVKPATPEAFLLHEVDMIDSRMNMLWNQHEDVYDEDAPENWTEFRRTLGARILFRGKNSADWDRTRPVAQDRLAGPGLAADDASERTAPSSLTLDLFDDDES